MREACLNTIYKLAKKNKKIVFIGSDLGPGVMDNFKKKIPKRFFMEGVSEQSIIGIASGLAKEGFIPYVNTIATFLTRRCFEQIVIDICLHNLPVRLIGNGGGLVYAPLGPTHMAIDDLAIMRSIPNIKIIVPCDAYEMKKTIQDTVNYKCPIYIRLAKGGEKIISNNKNIVQIQKGNFFIKPKKYLFISTGIASQIALEAAKYINKKKQLCGVLHLGVIKPLDFKTVRSVIKKVKKVIIVEEAFKDGGLGTSILESMSENLKSHVHKICRIGLQNKFISNYGDQHNLLRHNKITIKNLSKMMLK